MTAILQGNPEVTEATQLIRQLVRDVPDFPKPGILFKDITTVILNPAGLAACIDGLAQCFADQPVDLVVGIESRGFVFGAPLAIAKKAGFVAVRKPGKLPGPVDRIAYALEYGEGHLEIHQGSIPTGARVLIIDDLLATGGTAAATAQLVAQQGGQLVGFGFVIELDFLGGRSKLSGAPVHSVVHY